MAAVHSLTIAHHELEDNDQQGIVRLIQWLVVLLLLTILGQEARLGLDGFTYPVLTIGVASETTGLPFASEVIILLILGAFGLGLATHRIHIRRTKSIKIVGLMTFLIFIVVPLSYLFEIEQDSSAFGTLRMILEGMALFVVISSLAWSQKTLIRIEVVFVLVAVFHSVIIAISYVSPDFLPFQVNIIPQIPYSRYAGLFLQPSRVSLLISIALVIVFVHFVSLERARFGPILIYGLAFVLLVVGLLLSQTRTLILAMPLGVMFSIYQLPRIRARAALLLRLLIIMGLVGAFIAIAAPVEVGVSRLSELDINSIEASRGFIWQASLGYMLEYPLGLGAGGLLPMSGPLQLPHAHNMYLQWGVMFGWLVLVLFLYFILILYRGSGRRILDLALKPGWSSSISAIRAAWVICLLAFMTETYLITNTGYWFWLLAGLLVAPYCESGIYRGSHNETR